PRGVVGARSDRVGRVEAPPAGAAADGDRLRPSRDESLAHALEHAPCRVRVRDEEVALEPLPLDGGPRLREEAQQTGVVDGEDRVGAVLGGPGQLEAAIRGERVPDDLGALRYLARRDR